MASYQDIDTRLKAVERKLEMTMELSRVPVVTSALNPQPQMVSLRDIYYAMQQINLTVDGEVINGDGSGIDSASNGTDASGTAGAESVGGDGAEVPNAG